MQTPIFLVGSTPLFLLGLEKVLLANHYPVQVFSSSARNESFHFLDNVQKPILLLELFGHYKNDQRQIRQLRKKCPKSSIMVFNNEDKAKQVKAYYNLGIKAYAKRCISPDLLLKAIQSINHGQKFLDPAISQLWADTSMGLSKKENKLTTREKEVLQLIVEENTTKEIASKLFISQCTAETHRINIIQKLGVRNTAGMVREAVSMGWCG